MTMLLLGLLAGCAGSPSAPVATPAPPPAAPGREPAQTPGERAAVAAVRQVGTPYRYGGTGPDGFDCSGLVQYAWRKAGRSLPRTTATQWRSLRPVRQLRTGDVLFFRIDGKPSHVGLYLGDRRFVHAPATGREVTVASLDAPFYRQAFIRAGRPD